MIIGVCGKIASGKSTQMKKFEVKGFYCIYADKIVHDLYKAGGEGAQKIALVFGKKYLARDGSVDRIKLRNKVFEDENFRKYLENVIHPLVYEEIVRLLKVNKAKNVAIESAYFDQNYLGDFVDEIVWVERPKKDILKTLIGDRGMSEEVAEKAYEIIKKPFRVDKYILSG